MAKYFSDIVMKEWALHRTGRQDYLASLSTHIRSEEVTFPGGGKPFSNGLQAARFFFGQFLGMVAHSFPGCSSVVAGGRGGLLLPVSWGWAQWEEEVTEDEMYEYIWFGNKTLWSNTVGELCTQTHAVFFFFFHRLDTHAEKYPSGPLFLSFDAPAVSCYRAPELLWNRWEPWPGGRQHPEGEGGRRQGERGVPVQLPSGLQDKWGNGRLVSLPSWAEASDVTALDCFR